MDYNGTVGRSHPTCSHVSPCGWCQAGLSQACNALGQVDFWLGKYDLWILRDDALRRRNRVSINEHVPAMGRDSFLALARSPSVRKNLDRIGDQLPGDVDGVREQHCGDYIAKRRIYSQDGNSDGNTGWHVKRRGLDQFAPR